MIKFVTLLLAAVTAQTEPPGNATEQASNPGLPYGIVPSQDHESMQLTDFYRGHIDGYDD